MFEDMTTVVDALPSVSGARLRAGDTFTARELATLAGSTVRIPDPRKLVHLQMRRYAGCPICSLHLRSFVRRKDELARAGVHEVAVFHSSAEALRKAHAELPFDVVPESEEAALRGLGGDDVPARAFRSARLARRRSRRALAGLGGPQVRGLPMDPSDYRRTSLSRRKVGSSRRSTACTPTTNGRSTSSWRW